MANLGNTIINGMLRVNGKLSVSDAITAPSFEGTATKAKQDGDGKVISSTYLKLTGGTLSGDLKFNHAGSGKPAHIDWNSGTVMERITINDESTDNHNVFEFKRSTDSGSTYSTLMSITSGNQVKATTFVGALSGNATSATKATQDGSGNTITSTYYKNTGGTLTTGSYNGVTIKRNGTGGSSVLYSNNNGNLGKMGFGSSGDLVITKGAGTDGTADMLKITSAGAMTTYGSITPSANNTASIGSSSMKYANVYATTFTGNATSATKATQDGDGKTISSTYLKLTGGTLTGNLTIDSDTANQLTVDSTGTTAGVYLYRHGADTNQSWQIENNAGVLNFNHKTVTETAFTKSLSIGIDGVTTGVFSGSLSGNATTATTLKTARTIGVSGVTGTAQSFNGSANIVIPITAVPASLITGTVAAATKATQDGNGKTISSTYLPLAGGTMTGRISSAASATTYILGVSQALFNATYTTYGAILSAPVKSGRICLSTYPR